MEVINRDGKHTRDSAARQCKKLCHDDFDQAGREEQECTYIVMIVVVVECGQG